MDIKLNLYTVTYTYHTIKGVEQYTANIVAPSPSDAKDFIYQRFGENDITYCVVINTTPIHGLSSKTMRTIGYQVYDRITEEKRAGQTMVEPKPIFTSKETTTPPIKQNNTHMLRKI